jgi:hypothetical protein
MISFKEYFILTEGARIQHAEDVIFWEGSRGAMRALKALDNLQNNFKNVTIKWDGCVHKETILETDKGYKSINEVIDLAQSGVVVMVRAHDLANNVDVMTEVINTNRHHGNKEWVKIQLEDGSYLPPVTIDHEIYTINRGWVPAGELTDADEIKPLIK